MKNFLQNLFNLVNPAGNAKNALLLTAWFLFWGSALHAQYFEKITSGELVDIKQRSYSASWADVNNNGFDDLLILDLQVGDQNMLYINNGDGTFTANPNSGITDHTGPSIAATWGDFDNNGYLDVYIANTGASGAESSVNFLFKNNGDGTFTRITEGAIVTDQGWSLGASWADYNNSGFIDLYVANFDGPNFFYENNGDGTFTKITSGELVTDDEASYGAYWADINNNGWPDLFVANAFGTTLPPDNSRLYINNGDGTFTQVTTGHIVNNLGISHGASWGDYTNNGYLDLFVSNHDWHDNKSNFLYENNGDGTFTYVEGINVTTDQNTSFGSAWLDVNNNGYLDLVVSNNKASNRHNFFYINNGDGSFTAVEDDPVVNEALRSFGVSVADYNNDGYPDLFFATYSPNQENGFYSNLGGTNNWLAVKLEGSISNRAAIGARINLWAGGLMQTREVASASGQYNSSSFVQNFGLAQNTVVDSLHVRWPSGIVNKYYDLNINQHLHLLEQAEDDGDVLSMPWSEDFSDGEVPAGWQITDLSGSGVGWVIENNYIVADSDANQGAHVWTSLTTPPVDCSDAENVHLYLNQYYRHLNDSYGKIEVSNDGETWVEVAHYTSNTGSTSYPFFEYDISEVADGESQVWVRFEYNDGEGWNWYWRIDVAGMYSPSPVPMPAQLVSPADGSQDVILNVNLQWNAGGGSAPDAFRVYLDENADPETLVYDGEDNSLIPEGLEFSTTYYWKVVPYNDAGDAEDVPVWSFTTLDDPTITEVPHFESFDNVTAPALPLGWTSFAEATSNAVVETSTFGPPHSPPNHIRYMNLGDAEAEITLITPPIALDLTELRVRFYARELLTGAYGNNYLEVGTIAADNAFTLVESIHLNTEYTEYAVSFEDYAGEDQHIALRALYGAEFQVVYLDNFVLEEIPVEPAFEVTPEFANFGNFPIGQISAPQVFTMRNTGAGILTISPDDILLTGDNADDFILNNIEETVNLGPGESATIEVSFAPLTEGHKSAYLQIDDNLGDKVVHMLPLEGLAYDAVFSVPFTEDFTDAIFPPAEWTRWAGLLSENTELTPVSGFWTHHVFGNQTPGSNNAAHINIYGTRNHWLVSPQIDLGENGQALVLEFEIALTPWTGTDPIGLGPDDVVAVLISTDGGETWTEDNVLIGWTEDDDISPTGDSYSINLAPYSGVVQFAFYAERPTGFNPDLRFYVNNMDVVYSDVEFFEVTFNITDNAGEPIDDATITLNGIQQEAGNYTFTGVPEGVHTYVVSQLCHETIQDEVLVDDNMIIDIVMHLDDLAGDANGDGVVNVLDVIAITVYYTEDVSDNFCFHNADVNGDGIVNILDVIGIINIFSSGKLSPHADLNSQAVQLYLDENGITLKSDGTLAGIQIEISGDMPAGFEPVLELPGFQMVHVIENGILRFMVFSLDNKPIPAGKLALVSFTQKNASLQWEHAVAGNLNAIEVAVVTHDGVITGVEAATEIAFKAYPNPASDRLCIEFNNPDGAAKLTLINIHGQAVKTEEIDHSGHHKLYFDLDGLPAGVYMIKLDFSGNSLMEKIILN